MKKIFILLTIFLLPANCLANSDVVYLEPTYEHFFDNPTTNNEMLEIANYQNEDLFGNNTDDDFCLDEEFTDSKIEKVFTKFINNKIQNGKMNLINAPINY